MAVLSCRLVDRLLSLDKSLVSDRRSSRLRAACHRALCEEASVNVIPDNVSQQ